MCVCCVRVCSYDVRFDPLPRSRATSLTRLRPCTNFTLGTYGFPVLASCFLSGHANNNQLQRAAVLRVSLGPFLPLPRSSSPTFPSLCRSIYLRSRILGVHTYTCTCVRPLARHCLSLPLPSFEGYVRFHTNASSRWWCTNFFCPLSLRFPCISNSSFERMNFCFLFSFVPSLLLFF